MHHQTKEALIRNMDDDSMREELDRAATGADGGNRVLYIQVMAEFCHMVATIGGGYHPDTKGEDYITLPDGYTPEFVDALGLAVVQMGQDPALWALAVLEGGNPFVRTSR